MCRVHGVEAVSHDAVPFLEAPIAHDVFASVIERKIGADRKPCLPREIREADLKLTDLAPFRQKIVPFEAGDELGKELLLSSSIEREKKALHVVLVTDF